MFIVEYIVFGTRSIDGSYSRLYMLSFFTILFRNIITNIYNIYVIINGYLFQDIDFHQCRGNSQHSMLSLPAFNNIKIYTYQQEIFLTFMLSDGVF